MAVTAIAPRAVRPPRSGSMIILAVFVAGACSPSQLASGPAAAAGVVPPTPGALAEQFLRAHNRHRAAAGVPPLQWDADLAAAAQAYGPQLAATGQLVHSPRASRPGQGENLWRGTVGRFGPEAIIESWASEKAKFRAGTFPNVSTTGDVFDIVHYSQMIWSTTTRVGCAMQRTQRYDYLICRYTPAGNIDGKQVP